MSVRAFGLRWLPLVVFVTLVLAACADGPREVRIGAEECAHCRMLITERRFNAQLLTDRGRTYVFDSIECMAAFLAEATDVSEDRFRSFWVTDFDEPGRWLPVDEARFLKSDHMRSPMGAGLSAYAGAEAASEARALHGGELLSWDEVRRRVGTAPVGGPGHGH